VRDDGQLRNQRGSRPDSTGTVSSPRSMASSMGLMWPAFLWRNFGSPDFFKLAAQPVIFQRAGSRAADLEWPPYRRRSWTLFLSAQRTDAAAVAPDMACEKRQINQRTTLSTAWLCSVIPRVQQSWARPRRHIACASCLMADAGTPVFAFCALQRELLYLRAIGFETAGGVLNRILYSPGQQQ